MDQMRELQKLLLQAAVEHSRSTAGQDKRDAVLYFVKTVVADMRRRRWYDRCWAARSLLIELEKSKTVAEVWRHHGCKSRQRIVDQATETPASNTGVTPLSDNVILAIQETLRGY